MARYDRIAALTLPDRADAMPCWPVLCELAGHERESELAHRSRIYFTALRPARRLIEYRFAVAEESFERQISAVRAEIDATPALGADRNRFRSFLTAVASRVPERVAAAALEIAAHVEARGHFHTAEEYARTTQTCARVAGNGSAEARALTLLARVARETARWDEAEALGRAAIDCATRASDRGTWANAVTELATLCRARGDADAAADLLAAVRRRGAEWKDETLLGDAAEALAAAALAARLPEVAVHEGWFALQRLQDLHRRRRLLETIAAGLRALKLTSAAEACYTALLEAAPGPLDRARTKAGLALCAAEAGDAAAFRGRHDATVLEVAGLRAAQQPPLLIELGRGCLLIGDLERAAAHAQKALDTAAAADDDVMSARARELIDWVRVQRRGGISAIRSDAIPAEDTRDLAAEIAGAARRAITVRT